MFNLKAFRSTINYLFLLLILFISSLIALIFYINRPVEVNVKKFDFQQKNNETVLSLDSNPFSGNELSVSVHLPDLSDLFKAWAFEPRPDSDNRKLHIDLQLAKDKQKRHILSGDKLYLKYDNGYKISEDPTDFWLVFTATTTKNIKVKTATKYQKEKIIEGSFSLKPSTLREKDLNKYAEKEYLALKSAIYLGPDLFLDLCEKENPSKQAERLIFPSNTTCYVNEGDCLSFIDNKWVLANKLNSKEFSLAKVKALTKSGIEIDLWQADSIKKRSITLQKVNKGTSLRVGDDFISDINIRTKKQVSCKIQGQRIVINEKDLLYKKDGLWKKGKVQDFEDQNEASEFFIFDKLEANSSKKVLIGYVFNSDKTQIAKVEVDGGVKMPAISNNRTQKPHQNKIRR